MKLKVVLTILCLIHAISVHSQETASFYYLPQIFQSSLYNPAVQNTSGKLVVGIPFLSGISGLWNANLPFNSLFYKGFDYSFHRLYDWIENEGKAQASADVSMFFSSLEHKGYTLSLSVKERAFSEVVVDKEIVRFIRDGAQSFYNSNEVLGSGTFFFTHYREVAPALSKRIHEHLDIGIRPKLLFGKILFEAHDLNFSVETETENEYLLLNTAGNFSLSGPFSHNRDSVGQFSTFTANVSPGDYFFQPRNMGVALDFGLVYKAGRFTELSVSLLDAGLIGFKHKSYDVDFKRPARYSKTNLYQSHTPNEDCYIEPREALKAFGDTISYLIDVREAEKRDLTRLPVKINLAGKYRFSEKVTAGFSNQITWFSIQPVNLFSTFLTTTFNPKFGIYGSLTLLNTSTILPGFGFCYTGNWIQFYCSGNNFMGIIHPASSKHLNLCIGINFLFDTK